MENTFNLNEIEIKRVDLGGRSFVGRSESEIKKRIKEMCHAHNFTMVSPEPIKKISDIEEIFNKWSKNVYGETLKVTAINTNTWGQVTGSITAELTEKHIRYAYLKALEEEWQDAHAKRKAEYENPVIVNDLLACWDNMLKSARITVGKYSGAKIKLPAGYDTYKQLYLKEVRMHKQNERWSGVVNDPSHVVVLNTQ